MSLDFFSMWVLWFKQLDFYVGIKEDQHQWWKFSVVRFGIYMLIMPSGRKSFDSLSYVQQVAWMIRLRTSTKRFFLLVGCKSYSPRKKDANLHNFQCTTDFPGRFAEGVVYVSQQKLWKQRQINSFMLKILLDIRRQHTYYLGRIPANLKRWIIQTPTLMKRNGLRGLKLQESVHSIT